MWRRIGYVVLLTLSNGISAQRLQTAAADSPMSMTSPRTTLTRGQYAPLLHRSSAAPHSTLPQRSRTPVFLRRDLRQRADYFANPDFARQEGKKLLAANKRLQQTYPLKGFLGQL